MRYGTILGQNSSGIDKDSRIGRLRISVFLITDQFCSIHQRQNSNFKQTKLMQVYENLVDAVNDLRQKGFTTDFHLAFDAIQCKLSGVNLSPDEFEIVAHHRFEANTDPDDSSVLYVIQSKDGKMKGTLISAYGIYADAASDEMIQKLSVHK